VVSLYRPDNLTPASGGLLKAPDALVLPLEIEGLGLGRTNALSQDIPVTSDGSDVDVVLAREEQLFLIDDYPGSATRVPDGDAWGAVCDHGGDNTNGLIVADIDATSPGDEIIAAIKSNTAGGSILILNGITMSQASSLTSTVQPCGDGVTGDGKLVQFSTVEMEADLGTALVTGDFDGDGVLDLAASAPSVNRVYVWLGPDMTTPIIIQGEQEATMMGTAMAAGNIDDDAGDELVVGSPVANIEGVANAGAAYVYDFAAGAFTLSLRLHDASPEDEQRFGGAVAVAPFGLGDDNVIVVGAKGEVFTYFKTTLYGERRAN
jgi:hypothetical protein